MRFPTDPHLQGCPDGYTYENGFCVANQDPICPQAYIFDRATGRCVDEMPQVVFPPDHIDGHECQQERETCEEAKEQCASDHSACQQDLAASQLEKEICANNDVKCQQDRDICLSEKGTASSDLVKCQVEKSSADASAAGCNRERLICNKELTVCEGKMKEFAALQAANAQCKKSLDASQKEIGLLKKELDGRKPNQAKPQPAVIRAQCKYRIS